METPQGWYWGRLHVVGHVKAIGYYYRDKSAGPSFNILVELGDPSPPASAIADAARAASYRGSSTFRMGAHEEVFVEGLPPGDAAFMRTMFDSPQGPVRCRVMRLTREEIEAYGLPAAPPWIQFYL
jgi:hypothetical protein